MSTEAKQKWALLANFSPCRYGDDETKNNRTEDVQLLSIRGQFTFGTKLQIFQKNALWKKYNLKPSPHDEKTHAN